MSLQTHLWAALCAAALLASCSSGGSDATPSGGSSSGGTPQTPGIPTLTASMQGPDVLLQWTAVPNATDYSIYGSPNPIPTTDANLLLGTSQDTSVTIQGLAAGDTFYFRVSSTVGGQESGLSNEVPVGVPGPGGGVPALTASVQGMDVQLQWTAVPTASEYAIYGSANPIPTADPNLRLGTTQGTSATVQGLAMGDTIYFRVTATIGSQESGLSNEEVVTIGGGTGGADPLFASQWHLRNDGQTGGTPGEDVRVEPVWAQGILGTGILISVVDDGFEVQHEDLQANAVPGGSTNYVDGSDNPATGEHGTSVAGVAASRDSNGLGGQGAAPRASLIGRNFLATGTDADMVDALTRGTASIDISNNSWGPDGGGNLLAAPQIFRDAIDAGLSQGRGGLGTVFLFAAGNSAAFPQANGLPFQNANYDTFNNYRGVISVGAVSHDGTRSFYSEPGANVWIAAPSDGDGNQPGITTADRSGTQGYNPTQGQNDLPDQNYTSTFGGTSSATPLTAGVVALILEANPNLSWRDVRQILARSARRNDPSHPDWAVNDAGHDINHNYGFGVVDASAAVALASTWANIGPEIVYTSQVATPQAAIPDGTAPGQGVPITDLITVAGSGITQIEWVEIIVTAADHTYVPDLEIRLINPSGNTVSVLAELHDFFFAQGQNPIQVPLQDYAFSSGRHLDEVADGIWTLQVSDLFPGDTGTLQSWQLNIYGR